MNYHEPVLLKEVIELMNPKSSENFIDCTLGDGGHTLEILKKIGPSGRMLAFELDLKASAKARGRLRGLEESYRGGLLKHIEIINDNFNNLKKYSNKLSKVDGILADLGLRSGHLEEGGGGFSFQLDEPLDMRFGKSGISASEIVNTYTTDELADIFKKFGEEKKYLLIAKAIVDYRKKEKKIETTCELSEIILDFYRKKLKTDKQVPWIGGIHPATRVFQALRIEANNELEVLEKLLQDGVDILSPGGRIGIISYHSLEDRIVKRFYRTSPHLVIITKKPVVPGEEEVYKNKKSRSAKLRVAIKK